MSQSRNMLHLVHPKPKTSRMYRDFLGGKGDTNSTLESDQSVPLHALVRSASVAYLCTNRDIATMPPV